MTERSDRIAAEHEALCALCVHASKGAFERPCNRCCNEASELTAFASAIAVESDH